MDINRVSVEKGIKEIVLQEIIQLAKQNSVEKVILFGSRARGDFKASLANLKDIFPYQEPYGNVEIAGMVGCSWVEK